MDLCRFCAYPPRDRIDLMRHYRAAHPENTHRGLVKELISGIYSGSKTTRELAVLVDEPEWRVRSALTHTNKVYFKKGTWHVRRSRTRSRASQPGKYLHVMIRGGAHFDYLNGLGAAVKIGDRVVAYRYGEPILGVVKYAGNRRLQDWDGRLDVITSKWPR